VRRGSAPVRFGPPANLPPAPRIAVAKALLGAGLLARAAGSEGTDFGLAWKLDSEAALLRITEAGLQAIGAAPAQVPPEPQHGSVAEPVAEPAGQAAAAAQEGTQAAAEPHDTAQTTAASEAAQGAPEAPQRPTPGQVLRGAAQAVLAAWDDAPSKHAGPCGGDAGGGRVGRGADRLGAAAARRATAAASRAKRSNLLPMIPDRGGPAPPAAR
jgi:hypothetical protein